MDPERPVDRTVAKEAKTAPPLPTVLSKHEVDEYSTFYRAAASRLSAYLAVGHGASSAEAAECAHEALVQLLHRWQSVQAPMAWCRRAAYSIFLDRKFSAIESFADVPATGTPLYSQEPPRYQDEQRERVLPLVAKLPARQRDVATLALEGLSLKEIAEELRVEEATVRSNLRHAKEQLAGLFRQAKTQKEDLA